MSLASPEQIVIAGDAESLDAAALWAAAHRPYRPFATTLWLTPGPAQDRIARIMPWAAAMTPRDGQAAAYVCRNFVCEAPTTRVADLVQAAS
jgi:uncharacterized protein YyaL (SSP411 family)